MLKIVFKFDIYLALLCIIQIFLLILNITEQLKCIFYWNCHKSIYNNKIIHTFKTQIQI